VETVMRSLENQTFSVDTLFLEGKSGSFPFK
jgi:hypothetical protein